MSEVLNVIYSVKSCWALLKGKELRGIREECNGLILLSKQLLVYFISENFLEGLEKYIHFSQRQDEQSLVHSAWAQMCVK